MEPDESDEEDDTEWNDDNVDIPRNSMSIFLCNAESIRYKLDELRLDACTMDVVCVTETWLDPSIPDDFLNIPGFMSPERKDRQVPDAGRIFHGGVACFIRNGLAYTRKLELEHPTLEVMWIEIATRSGKFLLSIVYRPPSEPVEYWTLLEENIQHARDASTCPVYMCGDFNNDTLNPRNTISRLLNHQGLTLVNCQPTHFAARPTCLDLFATTTPQKVNLVVTTGPTLSNHSAVILYKDGTENSCGSYTRTVTDYSRANWGRINEQLLLMGETQENL